MVDSLEHKASIETTIIDDMNKAILDKIYERNGKRYLVYEKKIIFQTTSQLYLILLNYPRELQLL